MNSVQRDGKQKHGRLMRLDGVPLRRQGNEVTWSKLGVGPIGAERDTAPQAQQGGVPWTLVLA